MTFRFIHSSDLHLGKRFGNFAGDLPGRLREGRHGVIARLAEHARQRGAATILLAGDTFDTETPAPEVRRQALAEMAHDASLRWVILPGNHDSLQAAQLWSTLRSEAPANVTLAVEAQPLELAPGAMLLPAPCTTRRPGRDLTEWMDAQASPEGALRIGLAHGAVQSFSEEGAGLDVIASRPGAARAGLDYLALGDWHGGVEINARTRYSGTPEPDRFKHDRPGEALLVALDGPSAPAGVTPLPTGSFTWQTIAARPASTRKTRSRGWSRCCRRLARAPPHPRAHRRRPDAPGWRVAPLWRRPSTRRRRTSPSWNSTRPDW